MLFDSPEASLGQVMGDHRNWGKGIFSTKCVGTYVENSLVLLLKLAESSFITYFCKIIYPIM